ncbi:MAG TPA: VOC family protein [Anseongella sp.]
MLKVNAYMNFDGQAEEAFNFYKSVFGGEFSAIHRMSDMPGVDELPENERNRLMHISLPLSETVVLMASDILPSAGHTLTMGNSNYISLHPDSKEEADRLFNGLSAGGDIEMPMEDQFWGDYFGSFKDKYGIYWMINFNPEF